MNLLIKEKNIALKMKGKSLLSVNDLNVEEIYEIIDLSFDLKEKQLSGIPHKMLEGKTLGMIFAKPSTRTRISFEAGIYQLGGLGMHLSKSDIQLCNSENIYDTSKVLSRYLNAIMIRTFNHQDIIDFAAYASIPIINGLTDLLHPCQALTDIFTIFEKKKKFKGLKLAYVGDGNNVAHSLLHACSKVGIDITIASPIGYEPNKQIVNNAIRNANYIGSKVEILNDPFEAACSADIIYTDVWASMGKEFESEKRKKIFAKFQVNSSLVKNAKPDYLFMHCLPAHRGEEVVNEIADSRNSIIFDQAENRLHVQKAIMALLM
ncbi:MAG: ornithine carbamoyltransferase [Ignavibacteriaceae bacterium]